MRSFLPFLLLALALPACQCGPDKPTPVTFRISNPLGTAIYVDDTDGRLGLRVARNVGGQWLEFVEQPACECLVCDGVCDVCECPQEQTRTLVRKVEAGGQEEREWDGQIRIDTFEACSGNLGTGPACLGVENPSLSEVLHLRLCYALSAPGAEDQDAGQSIPANLGQTVCVEKPFTAKDGLVQISPSRGADCTQHSDCKGEGELCFGGACTTACPAAGFPRIGGAWQVRIPEPDNQGFFTFVQEGQGGTYTGTGQVGSVRYDNNTMALTLGRPGPNGGTLTGILNVTLPQGVSVPIQLKETLQVMVVDRSEDKNPENRGVVLRDAAGTLLLAAETGQQGMVLSPQQTAPFTVQRVNDVVGCEETDCGKNLFHTTRFAAGAEAAEVSPGGAVQMVADGQVWQVANVADEAYASSWCTLTDLAPYAVANQRQGTGP